jgi:hypothetical protein
MAKHEKYRADVDGPRFEEFDQEPHDEPRRQPKVLTETDVLFKTMRMLSKLTPTDATWVVDTVARKYGSKV